ncbi:kinase-like domain-containing protein [Rhizoctonia solani]|nr:kinase-like domain-containing protein [Rhizoctonia solani]
MISGTMPTHDILAILRDHGCEDITQQLDLDNCGQFPVSNDSFGDVFKGTLQSGTPITIKCLRVTVGTNDQEGQKQLKRAAHEIYVWSKCKHPNILELTGIAQYQDRIAMVSPWMKKWQPLLVLTQAPTVDRAQKLLMELHIYTRGIVHGDLKGANIVVSDGHTPKLVDFGTSFLSHYSLQFSGGTQSGAIFTIRYTVQAPEITLETSNHTMAGDVYGLGMTILEVITGLTPYHGINEAAVMRRVMEGANPPQPEQFMSNDRAQANNLWALLTRYWRSEADDRPSPTEVADNDISLALNYGTIVSRPALQPPQRSNSTSEGLRGMAARDMSASPVSANAPTAPALRRRQSVSAHPSTSKSVDKINNDPIYSRSPPSTAHTRPLSPRQLGKLPAKASLPQLIPNALPNLLSFIR